MFPSLERMIEELEEKNWYSSELYFCTGKIYRLKLWESRKDSTFQTTGKSVKECFEEAWKRLV